MKKPSYTVTASMALLTLLLSVSCSRAPQVQEAPAIIKGQGSYPFATTDGKNYYFIIQSDHGDSVNVYRTPDLRNLALGEKRALLTSAESGMYNIWSPELYHIDGKWYLYFESDDGNNTDNHQIFVLENPSEDPWQGDWTLHGPIITNPEWNFGIHPSTFIVGGRQYLLWSGWQKRRTESETQCIFIAEMENPWTLSSERVMISSPVYEWERQWINPDGSRTAYPIYVNENPEPIVSPDGKNVVVVYSASGIWTEFNHLGMLYAPADSDLLDPAQWHKLPEPQFVPEEGSGLFGTSNVSVIPGVAPDGSQKMVYQAKYYRPDGQRIYDIRLKDITWDDASLPVFGNP